MRAREPDADGFVDRGGVKLHREVFGDAGPPFEDSVGWGLETSPEVLPMARDPVKVNLLIREFAEHAGSPAARRRP